MGLDGLKVLAVVVVVAAAGCAGSSDRADHLLDGRPATRFAPVPGAVVTAARVLRAADVEREVDDCLGGKGVDDVDANEIVVERVGLDSASLTFADRGGDGVYACDGGADAAGERRGRWCAAVFGEQLHGRLLDPRLDVRCRDHKGRALAYAFVDPVHGAHWIGVRQERHVELYEVLGRLPVRIASAGGIDLDGARAAFDLTQYDINGRELTSGEMKAQVAG